MKCFDELFNLVDELSSEIFAEELYRVEGVSMDRIKEKMKVLNRYIVRLKTHEVQP